MWISLCLYIVHACHCSSAMHCAVPETRIRAMLAKHVLGFRGNLGRLTLLWIYLNATRYFDVELFLSGFWGHWFDIFLNISLNFILYKFYHCLVWDISNWKRNPINAARRTKLYNYNSSRTKTLPKHILTCL